MKKFIRWSAVAVVAAFTLSGPLAIAAEKYKLVSVNEPDKKVARTWKAKCGSCHGVDGKGQTDKGKEMKINDYTAASWQTARDDAQLRKAIVEGYKGEKDGVKQEMDGYKGDLDDAQIDALVQYIRWVGAPKK